MYQQKSSIKHIIIGITLLLFSIGIQIYPYKSIPNAKKITAEIVKYQQVIDTEDYEESIMWRGTYEFVLDNQVYSIDDTTNYSPKSIVPKKVTVYYNPENPSQHNLRTTPFLVCLGGGIGLVFLLNGIRLLKKSYII